MNEICNKTECTACGACINACPWGCITMQRDPLDAIFPVIDHNICVNCGICKKVCPNKNKVAYNETQKVYASWSKDEIIRKKSASGGIAAELYLRYIALGEEGFAVGVQFDEDYNAIYKQVKDLHDLCNVQNSKYVYSNTLSVFKDIKDKLKDGIQVLFVGLPCQVSGLYSYLKKEYLNLLTIDLVCHGVAPSEYLKQHIRKIEDERNDKTKALSFRDWRYYTYTYTFTLENIRREVFYKRKVYEDDVYQLGYHNALIYRENCYKCKYAQRKRVGDLTLCDFTSVGTYAPFNYDKNKVSCILVNTDKGSKALSVLRNRLFLEERPLGEIFDFESQLNLPYAPHRNRQIFIEQYRKSKNFEYAAKTALQDEINRYYYSKSLWGRLTNGLKYPIQIGIRLVKIIKKKYNAE